MLATAKRPRIKLSDLQGLTESYTLRRDDEPQLKIDEENGIIYGVKLGGRFSSNCHGIEKVTRGTEYRADAYRSALPLYEGVKVYCKHARNNRESSNRGPFESIGVIKNARYDDGRDCPVGDFHYKKTHPDASQLLEDVKRGLGTFGFSHHIPPGGFEGRIVEGRLVVDRIKEIKSVDLVDDPATTRNLWESNAVTKTFKTILTDSLKTMSKERQAIGRKLLEDGEMAMDAPVDDAPADPDEQLWAGFKAAVMAILDGDGSAADKAKKIGAYLKAHEKLSGDTSAEPEPEAPAATEEDEDKDGDGKKDDDEKDAKESKEIRTLRAENACLKAGVEASPALIKALGLLESQADRDELLAAHKPTRPTTRPKSSPPAKLQEGKESVPTGDKFAASIRG